VRSRSSKTVIKLLAAAVALGLLGTVVGIGTWAAFSDATSNTGNQIQSGTVKLDDNDSGSTMFSLSNLRPADTDTSCIKVTYTGSVGSTVRVYGSTTGTGLDPYLSLTVTRGTYSSDPGFSSCANFSADSTTYVTGQSSGVIYVGTLQDFADNYAAGIVDPTSGSPETWSNNENHVYKFQVTAGDNDTAQSKNATQTFTWEGRNN
jgi:predicted ribosomally synthesized peptide with SipW-like signal peptide